MLKSSVRSIDIGMKRIKPQTRRIVGMEDIHPNPNPERSPGPSDQWELFVRRISPPIVRQQQPRSYLRAHYSLYDS